MRGLLLSDYEEPYEQWSSALRQLCGVQLQSWPTCSDLETIEIVITDTKPASRLSYADMPSLKLICFLGHGVSDVICDRTIASEIQVTRLRDHKNKWRMTGYALHAILDVHNLRSRYENQQAAKIWKRLDVPDFTDTEVFILGLGAIGSEIARVLSRFGFRVTGWSRTAHSIEEVSCVTGIDALERGLRVSDYVLAVLPETPETIGLLSRSRLALFKQGSHLINIGRGTLVDEDVLVEAIEQGPLGGATLDVVSCEPLPSSSPLWDHPAIRLTPHTGGVVDTPAAIRETADNINRLRENRPLLNVVDRATGY